MLKHSYLPLRFPWNPQGGKTLVAALGFLALSVCAHLVMVAWGLQRKQTATRSGPVVSLLRTDSPRQVDLPNENPALLLSPRVDSLSIRAPWQELLEQSRVAAAKNQTELAFKAISQAEAQMPPQPAALAEMAVQYEKMGLNEQAIKLWEAVFKFGPGAGVYFSAADAKLSMLRGRLTPPPKAAPLGAPSSAPVAPSIGNLDSKLGLVRFGKFLLRDSPDNSASNRSFVLNVPVQRAENATIEATEVFIQVQFYDQINGRSLEKTNATVSGKWTFPTVSWTHSKIQTLQISYNQSQQRSGRETRKYYGYVAGVYYKGKLLDTRADPPRLGQQYPPPRTTSREPAQ